MGRRPLDTLRRTRVAVALWTICGPAEGCAGRPVSRRRCFLSRAGGCGRWPAARPAHRPRAVAGAAARPDAAHDRRPGVYAAPAGRAQAGLPRCKLPGRPARHPRAAPSRASPSTPAGIEGMAEGGRMAGIGALMHAVNDVLSPAGAGRDDQPATPPRIWRALRAAERKGPCRCSATRSRSSRPA